MTTMIQGFDNYHNLIRASMNTFVSKKGEAGVEVGQVFKEGLCKLINL